jgi:tripartite-type tricarboxylate transporter receptor subunit TctC
LLFGLMGAAFAASYASAAYPDKSITIIVPWGAGGGTDMLARTFAQALEEEMGQKVNVVNQTGGGGIIGHSAISNARPDGYTLGVGTVEMITYRALNQANIGSDSFTVLRRLASLPGGVTVNTSQPWNNLSELLNDVSKNPPGTYTASGCSFGCSWHLALAGLLDKAGIEPDRVRFVPSTGGSQALQEVVSGGATIYPGSLGEGRSLVDSGMAKQLAVMYGQKLQPFPSVPTVKEAAGFDWSAGSWFAFLGPKNLPDDLRAKLQAAADKAVHHQNYEQFLNDRGFVASNETASEFASALKAEETQSTLLVQKLGLGK